MSSNKKVSGVMGHVRSRVGQTN